MIRYTIAIDSDHDGSFRTAGEDITAQVVALRWRLGMRQPYDSSADHSRAQITVRSPQGGFSPERRRLQSGTGVRIQSHHDGITRSHFTGFVDYVEVDGGEWGAQQAVIHLQDLQPWLDDSPLQLEPQVDVTADEVIDRLLSQAIVRRRALAGHCIIDVAGYSRIDAVRIFPPQNLPRRLDAGKTRFAYAGDWWHEMTPIRQAIHDLTASERGRFYIDRAGQAVFLNRHHTLVSVTPAAQFADDMSGIDYRYGDLRLNRIALVMTPREVGAGGTLMWQLSQAQRIAPHAELRLNLRFVDGQNEALGLLELEDIEARFHLAPQGSGAPLTGAVQVEVLQRGLTSIQLQIRSESRRTVYLTALRVIGKPLYRRDRLEIVAADGAGMHLYGLRQLRLDLPALSDIETAHAFAAYEIARRKHPAGRIHSLRLDARARPQDALRLTLFDRIRISEAQTGQRDADYFIVAEAHQVEQGGSAHTVTFTLEPADSARFVIIDDSAVDASDRLLAPY